MYVPMCKPKTKTPKPKRNTVNTSFSRFITRAQTTNSDSCTLPTRLRRGMRGACRAHRNLVHKNQVMADAFVSDSVPLNLKHNHE